MIVFVPEWHRQSAAERFVDKWMSLVRHPTEASPFYFLLTTVESTKQLPVLSRKPHNDRETLKLTEAIS